MATAACPSLDELRQLDSEFLDDSRFAVLEAHLEQCGRCRAQLEQLLAEASLLPSISPGPEPDPPGIPPSFPGYRVRRELGRGAHGVVYLATRVLDGSPVALKCLGGSPVDLARWRREAETLRQLELPGVVRLFDAHEAGGWVCLVMEYLDGGSLEQRLDPDPSAETAARLVEEIARTIETVHQSGLLHLDLKPSNILLSGDRDESLDRVRPLVADFGLALPWGDAEATWTMALGPRGTPSYMAPEQLVPERAMIGPAADVYALGAILYRMLTGRPPFLASTKLETYLHLRDRDPVSVRRLNPSVPESLETICLACLRKSPGQRYASAEALADDLRRFLNGRPIRQRPTSNIVKGARWCRRNPLVSGLSLALAVSLVSLVFVQSARLRVSRAEEARLDRELVRLEENLTLSTDVLTHYSSYAYSLLFKDRAIDASFILAEITPVRARLERARESGTIDPANLYGLGLVDLLTADILLTQNRPLREIRPHLIEARNAFQEAMRRAPAAPHIAGNLERLGTHWFLHRIGATLGYLEHTDYAYDWEGSVSSLVDAIEADLDMLGIDRQSALTPVMNVMSYIGISQRNADHPDGAKFFFQWQRLGGRIISQTVKGIDEAERTAELYEDIAQELHNRYPTEPAFVYLLAEVYQQKAKNCWKRDNLDGVRHWLARSIEVNEHAVALDPSVERYQTVLADRRRRLAELSSD
ncbi:serine/threonine protein kinase [Tautonia rosea]|uniref:serine/threonine protein kinase n=1 Tax=Tautonia rosea TaxID=2728037 RepID=UPI001475F75E|nr:serine/threonine-protein kinase [Tautonia rosea]